MSLSLQSFCLETVIRLAHFYCFGCSLLVTLGNKSTLTPGERPPHHSNVLPVRRQTRARSAKERRFRSREVTATVLQPGWYRCVRAGQTAAANSMKYLQNGVIIGRSRTC